MYGFIQPLDPALALFSPCVSPQYLWHGFLYCHCSSWAGDMFFILLVMSLCPSVAWTPVAQRVALVMWCVLFYLHVQSSLLCAHTPNTTYTIVHTQIDCILGFGLILSLTCITVIFFSPLKFSLAWS